MAVLPDGSESLCAAFSVRCTCYALKEKAELQSFLKTAAQERPFKSNPLPLIPRACKSLSLTLDCVCQWGNIKLL